MKDSVRCLFLKSNHKTLIVPYTAVAEVIPFQPPKPINKAPEWLVGEINWREISIPLVSFDKIVNPPTKESSDKAGTQKIFHIAVFNRIADIDNIDFIGLVIQDIPLMGRFKEKDFEPVADTPGSFLRMEALVHQRQVFIPNLEWIERCISVEKRKQL